MGSDVVAVSPRETQFTTAMDNTQMTQRPEKSTVQGVGRRGPTMPCVCWLLTRMHGSHYCLNSREENRRGRRKGRKLLHPPVLKKSPPKELGSGTREFPFQVFPRRAGQEESAI